MLEHIVEFTAWPILTGILIGYVANRIMSGEGKGCCMNLIVGIIGFVMYCTGKLERFGIEPIKVLDFRDKSEAPAAPAADAPAAETPAK